MLSLEQFLISVLGGTFALGPFFFWIIEHTQQDGICHIPEQYRRLVIAVACGATGLMAWTLAAWLGYVDVVYDRRNIAEAVWNYGILTGFSAFVGSQVTHAMQATTKLPHIVADDFRAPEG